MLVIYQSNNETNSKIILDFFSEIYPSLYQVKFTATQKKIKTCKVYFFSSQNLLGKFLFPVKVFQNVFFHCCCFLSLTIWSTVPQSKEFSCFISSLKPCLGAEGHLLVKGNVPLVTVFKRCLLSLKAFLVECKWPRSRQFAGDSSV